MGLTITQPIPESRDGVSRPEQSAVRARETAFGAELRRHHDAAGNGTRG